MHYDLFVAAVPFGGLLAALKQADVPDASKAGALFLGKALASGASIRDADSSEVKSLHEWTKALVTVRAELKTTAVFCESASSPCSDAIWALQRACVAKTEACIRAAVC